MVYSPTEYDTPNFWFSKRFLVAILMLLGTIHEGAFKGNLPIAVVEMTNSKTITLQNETIIEKAEFSWNSKTTGFLLSANSYGLALSFFGSSLALKFGGATMIGVGICSNAVMALLTPLVIRYSIYAYIVVRVFEGIFEGLGFVCYSEVWSQWAPVHERSKLLSIALCGLYISPILVYPVCGYVIHMFGWPASFYVTGVSGFLWWLIWFTFVTNDPASDKWISKKELAYIKDNQVQTKRPKNVMAIWKGILTSKCIWVLCFCKFVTAVGSSFGVTCFPTYIKDITNAEIHKVGIYTAIPSILNIFTVPITGYAVDYLQNKKILNSTQVNKTFMCAGFVIGAASLFCVASFNFSFTENMICFVIVKVALSLNFIITHVSCICVAPQCSSFVAGTLTLFLSLGFVISPTIVGFIVTHHSKEEWNLCISLTAVVLLLGALAFLIWGSAEPQPWSYSKDEDEENCDQRHQK